MAPAAERAAGLEGLCCCFLFLLELFSVLCFCLPSCHLPRKLPCSPWSPQVVMCASTKTYRRGCSKSINPLSSSPLHSIRWICPSYSSVLSRRAGLRGIVASRCKRLKLDDRVLSFVYSLAGLPSNVQLCRGCYLYLIRDYRMTTR